MQLVAVVHVLAEHEREAVDELLHRRRRDVEDAHAALFGEHQLAGGRGRVVGRGFGVALAHATSSATAGAIAGVAAIGGAVTCARSPRSRYHGRRLIHAGAMLP